MQQRSPGHHIEMLSWWHTPKLLWLSASPPAHSGGGDPGPSLVEECCIAPVCSVAMGTWPRVAGDKKNRFCKARGGTDVLFHEESMPLAHVKQGTASSISPHTHGATWSPGIAPRWPFLPSPGTSPPCPCHQPPHQDTPAAGCGDIPLAPARRCHRASPQAARSTQHPEHSPERGTQQGPVTDGMSPSI